MSHFIDLILSPKAEVRDRSMETVAADLSDEKLLSEIEALEQFWKGTDNLYHRVRALSFLHALHRFVLPERGLTVRHGVIPFGPLSKLYDRRYAHAIQELLGGEDPRGDDTVCSGLALAYEGEALQTLADQVRRCVRNTPGNRWMFRMGHPLDHPLRIRGELLDRDGSGRISLVERTPVRMDLSHSAWSDIFFLAMDRPEFAQVLNVSVDLCERRQGLEPRPPVEAWFRVIDQPIVRLVSVDLEAVAEIDNLPEIFDFGRDYLGLLKAALIASGIIPPGMEGSGALLSDVLRQLAGPGRGIELASMVYNIPKGSRLAVSTNLLAALIAACMRATGQIATLEGPPEPWERSLLAARAILGEWLGGSGGGWQDSGGVWPGIKLIEGALASEGDSEYGISRGRLLPEHTLFDRDAISAEARAKLQSSLILVHGGLAQNVGPILEMVTGRYLLRSPREWTARQEALSLTGQMLKALQAGDVRELGRLTTANFFGPIKTIIPWASNAFTESLVEEVSLALGEDYWGFWMLGGMSGGGMGFMVDPAVQESAKDRIGEILQRLKARYQSGLPFAIEPILYDFAINERGTVSECGHVAWPEAYYRLRLPQLLRKKPSDLLNHERRDLADIRRSLGCAEGRAERWLENLLPEGEGEGEIRDLKSDSLSTLLKANGFDAEAHEQLRQQLLEGSIGLSQNRLPPSTVVEDVADHDLLNDFADPELDRLGRAALDRGEVAVVTLAAGAGSRWTAGAGVVKALHPFAVFDGRYRNFLEVHLAKTARASEDREAIPHLFTTSYLTHDPIAAWFADRGLPENALLSRGSSVGNRLVPTLRDLRFAWEETPQPRLDEQAQKVRASTRKALMEWARRTGEGSDYRDNLPEQCLHPVGHWYEVPNLLLNGSLAGLLRKRPALKHLLLHNIDTLGATVDPALLGAHLSSGHLLNFEVISRRFEDVGGGLARINGQLRLVEGMALPRDEDECKLRYYNTLTTWVDLDQLLGRFGLSRDQLEDAALVRERVRETARTLPTYMTLKEVKKRWGRGQEDIFPVLQFERLWGDMSALSGVSVGYFKVPRSRGQQLKDPAQLDPWLRDGSRNHIESLCRF